MQRYVIRVMLKWNKSLHDLNLLIKKERNNVSKVDYKEKAYEIEKQIYVLEQIETELVNYNKLLEKELKQINSKIKTL